MRNADRAIDTKAQTDEEALSVIKPEANSQLTTVLNASIV